jgi:small multidrug resistance pump
MIYPLIKHISPTIILNTNTIYLNLDISQDILCSNSIIKPEYYLISSILLETLSTTLLKKTIQNKAWFLPVYLGYGISFYIFPKSLTKFSLSTAYTLWCGIGIIFTTAIDTIIHKELLMFKKIMGIIIIIFGINFIK